MIGVSTVGGKTNSSPRANPLLLYDSQEEMMRRGIVEEEEGKDSDWLLQFPKRHLQSLLPPIRDTGIEEKGKALIGVVPAPDWCLQKGHPQSCAETPSPSILAQIRASQTARVTGL